MTCRSRIVLDFETISACDLKRAGAWRYAEDPTTAVLCLTWEKLDDGTTGSWTPGQPYPFVGDDDALYVAHNAAFEKAIWRRIMVPLFGWPDVPNHRWGDTMAACAQRSLPQELDTAVKILGLPHQKDLEGKKLVLGLSRPDRKGRFPEVTDDVLARSIEYCAADTRSEVGLLRKLGDLPRQEWLAWQLDQRINDRGLAIDLGFVRASQDVARGAMAPLKQEFAEITGGLGVGQRDKVLGWLVANGLYVEDLTKESLAEVMGEVEIDDDDDLPGRVPRVHDVLAPAVRRALDIRRLVHSSSLKKLDRLLDCTCSDGRVRGAIAYHAAGPGRWGGRLFQPQNFPRGRLAVKFKPDLLVDAIMTGDHEHVRTLFGEPIDVVVSGLRHAVVAERGRTLLSGDYAGIQARTTLAIAGQRDKVAMMAAGQDVYADMAEAIYKQKVDKNKDPEKRQVGKNSVLGLGFQMGAKKFQWKYAQGHLLPFCKHVVQTYREDWAPEVTHLWSGLEMASERAFREGSARCNGVEYQMRGGWLVCHVPTGGEIWYRDPIMKPQTEAEGRRIMGDDVWEGLSEERREQFLSYEHLFCGAYHQGKWLPKYSLFGGRLTQNVVTRVEVDMIVYAGILCENMGFPICLTVHDELISEPLKEDADEELFREIMLDVGHGKLLEASTLKPEVKEVMFKVVQGVQKMGIPVAVETWQGDRYKK